MMMMVQRGEHCESIVSRHLKELALEEKRRDGCGWRHEGGSEAAVAVALAVVGVVATLMRMRRMMRMRKRRSHRILKRMVLSLQLIGWTTM